MASYAAQSRRNVLMPLLAVGAAAFVFGVGVGSLLGSHSKTDKATNTQTSSKNANPNSSSVEDAATTASNFLTSFPELARPDKTTELTNTMQSLAYPFSDSTFKDDVTASITSTQKSVTTEASFQIMPLGFTSSSATDSTIITIPSVGILADPGTGQSYSVWSTSTFTMHYYLNSWRIAKWSIVAGPSLSPAGTPYAGSVTDLKNQLGSLRGYQYAAS